MFATPPAPQRPVASQNRRTLALGCILSLTSVAHALANPRQESRGVSPARFVENLGQWPANVRFAADVGGVVARAECEGLGFHAVDPAGNGAYVRFVFNGGAAHPEPRGVDPLPGVHHYYFGNDPSQWRTNARAYARVEYEDLYPGVDLVLRSEGASPKYDLVFEPGVDVSVVRARWVGLDQVTASGRGLLLGVGGVAIHELPVVAWQTAGDGRRVPADVVWVAGDSGTVSLHATSLDPTLPLVVDPEVVWGTYLGSSSAAGSGDRSTKVRIAPSGHVYVLGNTTEFGFPTTPGAFFFQPNPTGGDRWVTVAKLDPSDGSAVYSALLGGSYVQRERNLSIDLQGRVLVIGETRSADFPTTPQAYDRVLDGEVAAFVFRLSGDGASLDFSTLLECGPLGGAYGTACHANEDGSSLVTGGFIGTPPFPSTMPPIGTVPQNSAVANSFVTLLDHTGSAILWSRLIGNGAGVAELGVARTGEVNLVGTVRSPAFPTTPGSVQPVKPHPTNAVIFALQLSRGAQQLHWSSFLGSPYPSEFTSATDLSIDDFGCLTLGFTTNSRTFPTTPGTVQPTAPPGSSSFGGGGVVRLAPDGSRLVYSTFLTSGGGGLGAASIDSSGVVTLIGGIGAYFPATPGSYDETFGPGSELQLARMDPHGRKLLHLRHFGGPYPKGISLTALDPGRAVVAAGVVQYPGGIPTTPGAFQPDYAGGASDSFIVMLDLQVAGVIPSGDGTPACHGPIVTEAWRNPVSGAADFGLYCSGAPELARGALLIGRPSSVPTTFGGATLHIDRLAGFRALRVTSDEYGYLETQLPVPALPPGTAFTAQYVFQNNTACPGSTRFSSSNALRLVVQ